MDHVTYWRNAPRDGKFIPRLSAPLAQEVITQCAYRVNQYNLNHWFCRPHHEGHIINGPNGFGLPNMIYKRLSSLLPSLTRKVIAWSTDHVGRYHLSRWLCKPYREEQSRWVWSPWSIQTPHLFSLSRNLMARTMESSIWTSSGPHWAWPTLGHN